MKTMAKEPTRVERWCASWARYSRVAFQGFAYAIIIAVLTTFLMKFLGYLVVEPVFYYKCCCRSVSEFGILLPTLFMISAGLFFIAIFCQAVRYAIILVYLNKFTLSFLFYNQLLLCATIASFITLSDYGLIVPLITGSAWAAMILGVIHECDPEVRRGTPHYFIAKKLAEERMRRRGGDFNHLKSKPRTKPTA